MWKWWDKTCWYIFKNYKLTMFLASKALWWILSWTENNSSSAYNQMLQKIINSKNHYLCLSFDGNLLIKFSEFNGNTSFQWSSHLFASSELPLYILSNFLCFNRHVLIENIPPFFDIFVTKAQAFPTNYLITMKMLNLAAILKRNLALTIFLTLNGNN